MNKTISLVCLFALVIACFVLVNMSAVYLIADPCENLGTRSEPCVEDEPFNNGNDDGPCVVDIVIGGPIEQQGPTCYFGGSLVVHNVNRRASVQGSQLAGVTPAPCDTITICEGPIVVTDGTTHPNDWVSHPNPSLGTRYRCIPISSTSTSITFSAGPCPVGE